MNRDEIIEDIERMIMKLASVLMKLASVPDHSLVDFQGVIMVLVMEDNIGVNATKTLDDLTPDQKILILAQIAKNLHLRAEHFTGYVDFLTEL
jgi:hypothetical protein